MISKKTAAQVSLAGSDWVQPALTRSGTTSASARKGDPDAMVEFELVKVQLPLSPGSVVKGWPVPAFIFPADWRPASDHSEPPAAPHHQSMIARRHLRQHRGGCPSATRPPPWPLRQSYAAPGSPSDRPRSNTSEPHRRVYAHNQSKKCREMLSYIQPPPLCRELSRRRLWTERAALQGRNLVVGQPSSPILCDRFESDSEGLRADGGQRVAHFDPLQRRLPLGIGNV